MLHVRSRARLAFFVLSLAVLGRTFLYSGSRGAFAGLVVGTVGLVWWTFSSRHFRPQLRRLGIVAAVALVGVLVVKPDLFERPNVSRMLSASQGAEVSTFRWRLEERWPHFWKKTLEHPWIGTGDYVDQTLGPRANTPHNGYLALAVKSGLPAVALYLLMGIFGIRDGLRATRRRREPLAQIFGALATAGLLGLLTHNIVDNILMVFFTRDLFWLLVGFAVIAARLPTAVAPSRSLSTSASWTGPHASRGLAGNGPTTP
jgi:O-antigen ligase